MKSSLATGSWDTITTVAGAAAKHERSSKRLAEAASLMRELVATRAPKLRIARASSSRPPTCPRGAGSILVVDDDEVSGRALIRLLLRVGYDPVLAASGAEACEKLASQKFDVAVVDLYLGPGCSGIAVAREARVRWPDVRVVLWTGQLDSRQLAEVKRDTGAVAAILKGAGPDALLKAVADVLA